MAILKKIKSLFCNIPVSVIRNTDLSDGDFRLLIYLYSLPENWKINRENLGQRLGCNKRNIEKKIKSLREKGYLRIEKGQNEYEYILVEKDTMNNDTIKKDTIEKDDTKEKIYKENIIKENINNIPPISPEWEKNFETFWEEYPKKQAKAKAKQWFEKNKPDKELMNKILESLILFKRTKQWQKNNGQFIPLATTWLNGKRWEDEIQEEVEMTEEEINAEIERQLREEGFYDNR